MDALLSLQSLMSLYYWLPFTPQLHLLRDAVTTGGDRGICRRL